MSSGVFWRGRRASHMPTLAMTSTAVTGIRIERNDVRER